LVKNEEKGRKIREPCNKIKGSSSSEERGKVLTGLGCLLRGRGTGKKGKNLPTNTHCIWCRYGGEPALSDQKRIFPGGRETETKGLAGGRGWIQQINIFTECLWGWVIEARAVLNFKNRRAWCQEEGGVSIAFVKRQREEGYC